MGVLVTIYVITFLIINVEWNSWSRKYWSRSDSVAFVLEMLHHNDMQKP